jgi:hypothetical protein
MWPAEGTEQAHQPEGEDHVDPGGEPVAAEVVVPAGGAVELDLSRLPETIGLEVTRILDAARAAGEQIRGQAVEEAREARSEAERARGEADRAHEEARLAREDAHRAREEAASMRARIARLQAEFTGLLREMEPLSDPASPTEATGSGTTAPLEPNAPLWSPAWGITEGESDGGDVAHAGPPGPGSDARGEHAEHGSTVVVPEAVGPGEAEGEEPEGPGTDGLASGETSSPAEHPGDPDENVPVLERLRRLATS